MSMKFSTEKYGESICWSLSLKKFLSGSVLLQDNTDSKEKKFKIFKYLVLVLNSHCSEIYVSTKYLTP